jgi:hypothetical protein
MAGEDTRANKEMIAAIEQFPLVRAGHTIRGRNHATPKIWA